jgi:CheY-like chemotaxis protein
LVGLRRGFGGFYFIKPFLNLINTNSKMKKILIIEDDESQAKTLLDYFNLLKYKTTITHSGEDGIKSLSKEKPDLIICDMILPGISGMNVLEIVRSKKGFELIPFIFLTAVKRVLFFKKQHTKMQLTDRKTCYHDQFIYSKNSW